MKVAGISCIHAVPSYPSNRFVSILKNIWAATGLVGRWAAVPFGNTNVVVG